MLESDSSEELPLLPRTCSNLKILISDAQDVSWSYQVLRYHNGLPSQVFYGALSAVRVNGVRRMAVFMVEAESRYRWAYHILCKMDLHG